MAYYTQDYSVSVNCPSPDNREVNYKLDRSRQQIRLQNVALVFKWQE
jgi:hypothetical protein